VRGPESITRVIAAGWEGMMQPAFLRFISHDLPDTYNFGCRRSVRDCKSHENLRGFTFVEFTDLNSVVSEPYISEEQEKAEFEPVSTGQANGRTDQGNRLIDRATGNSNNDFHQLRYELETIDPPGWDQALAQEKAMGEPLRYVAKYLTSSISDKALEESNFGKVWQEISREGITGFAVGLGVTEETAAVLAAIGGWAALQSISSIGETASEKTADLLFEYKQSNFERSTAPTPSRGTEPSGIRISNPPQAFLRANKSDTDGPKNSQERYRKQ
jgi:hypothetical protein